MTKRKALANTKSLPSTTKRANFDQVAAGVCPHDSARLGDEIRGSGIGVTRVCETCGHRWYLNKKIKTCKCLSCSADKRKAKSVADVLDDADVKTYNHTDARNVHAGVAELADAADLKSAGVILVGSSPTPGTS
jgi:putative component of toxin-antitoxin plasmid stabilization module